MWKHDRIVTAVLSPAQLRVNVLSPMKHGCYANWHVVTQKMSDLEEIKSEYVEVFLHSLNFYFEGPRFKSLVLYTCQIRTEPI